VYALTPPASTSADAGVCVDTSAGSNVDMGFGAMAGIGIKVEAAAEQAEG
jgi:hypothetical protein